MAGLSLAKNPYLVGQFKPEDQLKLTRPLDRQTVLDNAREQSGSFSSGFNTSVRGLRSSTKALAGQVARTAGYEDTGQGLIDQAVQETADQEAFRPRVSRLSDIKNTADFGSYVAGAAGSGTASILPQAVIAATTRGVGLSPAASYAATAAPVVAPTAGDALMRINADPATANLSDAEKLAIVSAEGVAGGALEAAVPYAIGRNAVGAGAKLARPSVAGAVKTTAGNMTVEAATEAAQQKLGQAVQGSLNPNRDTTQDNTELLESAAQGFFGAGPTSVAGAVAQNTLGASRQAAEAGLSQTGQYLKDKAGKLDFDAIRMPQRAPAGADVDSWLDTDDTNRNAVATKLAEAYATAKDVSSKTKQAAADYLSGSRTEDAWRDLVDASANEERAQKVRAGIDRFSQAVNRGVQSAKDAVASRQNLQATTPDAFDAVLSDALYSQSDLVGGDEILNELPKLTQGVRQWISNGFREGTEIHIPDGLTDVFADPVAAITEAQRLMVKQGLVEDDKATLTEVTSLIKAQAETSKVDGSIIEDNLLPTAQAQYQFSGADHKDIASQLRSMISTGAFDEATLDQLFGANKNTVLEALEKSTPRVRAGFQSTNVEVLGADGKALEDDQTDASYEELEQITNPIKPNEIGARVKFSDVFKTGKDSSELKAKNLESKLSTANGQVVKRVGYVDALREQYDGRPEAFLEALVTAVQNNKSLFVTDADKARPEVALNDKLFVLRTEDASDKRDDADIKAEELVSITPGTKNNVWAISIGKNNEYGDLAHGAVYFERTLTDKETGEVTTKVFATNTNRLVKRGRSATTQEGKLGIIAALKSGITSMLNATDLDGRPATSGRVGFRATPDDAVVWADAKDKLPAELKLPSGEALGSESLAQKKKINTENATELRAWVNTNEAAVWSRDNQVQLDTAEAARAAGANNKNIIRQLNRDKERAEFVETAKKALKDKDAATIAKVLDEAKDDWGTAERGTKEIAVVNEVSQGKSVVDKDTGKTVRPQKTETKALSEGEEMTQAAVERENNTPRTFDEETGLPLQPRERTAKPDEVSSDNKKLAEQVAYLTKLLDKGIPAFNTFVAGLTAARVSSVRRVLNNMLEGTLPDALRTRVEKAITAMGSEKPMTRTNKQNIEAPANLTEAEQKTIRDDIKKRLGDDITVEFLKNVAGVRNAKGATQAVSGEWQEGLIRIAITAQDPAGVGAHEALHEFFNRLMSSDLKDAKRVKDILTRTANNGIVLRQVERLLAEHPAALAQIKEGSPNYEEERLAYTYQFWQAGLLKLGPETKSTFQTVADFFRSVIGKLSDEQKTEQILQAFHDGKTQTASAAAEVLASNIELRERQVKAAFERIEPVTNRISRFMLPVESSMMNSENPHIRNILIDFKNPTGVGTAQSLIEAKSQKHAQYVNKLESAIGKYEAADIAMAAEHLRNGTEPKDAIAKKIVGDVRGVLAEMETYMRDAGVKRYDEKSKKWVEFGHIKDYYPRAYDVAKISKDPAGFMDTLLKHHKKELDTIARQANDEVANEVLVPETYASAVARDVKQAEPITAEQVAQAITSRIIGSFGQPDVQENETSIGYSPNTRAINKRTLKWIDVSKFGDWMDDDLVSVMTTYIGQGTKRAESVRKFGNNSDRLTAKVESAFQFEVDKALEDDNKLSRKDAEAIAVDKLSGSVKDIMALEGTIGHDINPRFQRLQGTILVYENIRTLGLSLFSQMIDPLGIMVRGGTMQEAFSTYGRGLREVKASWTGEKIDDKNSQVAELIGTVDSAGFLANFGQAYSSMFIHQKARKWNEALFKYNGMDGFNRASRIQATQAAIGFIKRQKSQPTHNTERYLEELLLDPKDIVIDANGDLNYENPKIQVAVKRWVDQSILRPNAAQRPAWMSDPHFVLFGHMKQFSYSFHDVILKRAWLEAKNHGELGPVGILLAGFVPMMIAADAAKAILLTGKEPYWMHDLPSTIEHGVRRAGLLGIAQPYADPLTTGHPFAVFGPTAEQAVSVLTAPIEESAIDALPGASIINTISGPASPSQGNIA